MTQSKEKRALWIIPHMYPMAIIIRKMGLFPPTSLVFIDLCIDIGQLIPKQTNMVISKALIVRYRLEKPFSRDPSYTRDEEYPRPIQ